MMIAARNAFLMPGAKLPYDSEVEYLESTGTQYIDTGWSDYAAGEISVCVRAMGAGDVFGNFATDTYVNGGKIAGTDNSNTGFVYYKPTSTRILITGRCITSEQYTLCAEFSRANARFSLSVNSTVLSTGTYSGLTTSYTYKMLWRGITNYNAKYVGRVYSASIIADGTPVRDFIPVRVGSGSSAVGYLYDRADPDGGPIGNGLYPNAGTGAFVIGPDK